MTLQNVKRAGLTQQSGLSRCQVGLVRFVSNKVPYGTYLYY